MTKKNIYAVALAVLALAAASELAGVHMHAPGWWPLPFGYDIFFGFAACWVLIVLAKIVMASLMQREEDYYEKGGADDE